MTHIAKGDTNRVVAAMQMNPRSSRGHGIVALHIIGEDDQPFGRLTLCDLAGMESSKKSAAVDTGPSSLAVRKEEAKRINVRIATSSQHGQYLCCQAPCPTPGSRVRLPTPSTRDTHNQPPFLPLTYPHALTRTHHSLMCLR
jgi:hypothetical protein